MKWARTCLLKDSLDHWRRTQHQRQEECHKLGVFESKLVQRLSKYGRQSHMHIVSGSLARKQKLLLMGSLMFLLLCSRNKRVLFGELDEDCAHDTVDYL